MLTNKQRAQLRTIAHSTIKDVPKIEIGKDLLDQNVILNINNCFKTHEIVKISFLRAAHENADKREIILDISAATKAEVIQVIGNTALLYKENTKLKDHIVLGK